MLPRSFLMSRSHLSLLVRRNFGISVPCLQTASDPIQKLFVDKIKDYSVKSKAQGGKLFEASPEIKKQLQDEMDKLARQFGADKQDFSKFPTFQFAEPDIELVSLSGDAKAEKVVAVEGEEMKEEEDDDKPWFER